MKLDRENQQAIKDFVKMTRSEYGDQIYVLVTVYENRDCGLYVKKGGTYRDIPCLCVAGLKDGRWIGLGHDLDLLSFTPDQVL